MSTPTATVEQRVAAGAAWLDEHEPGWVDRIDLDLLNIASGCECVLGQLHGHFDDSPFFAELPKDEYGDVNSWDMWNLGGPLGFALIGPDVDEWPTGKTLTAAWRQLIETRRSQT